MLVPKIIPSFIKILNNADRLTLRLTSSKNQESLYPKKNMIFDGLSAIILVNIADLQIQNGIVDNRHFTGNNIHLSHLQKILSKQLRVLFAGNRISDGLECHFLWMVYLYSLCYSNGLASGNYL